jgi:hypothetical protein
LDDNSITGVLEIVAKEAGIENAMMLAEMFGLQVSDDLTSGITLLPPNRAEEVCPFDPVTNRANYRNWYHKRHGGFPEDFEE